MDFTVEQHGFDTSGRPLLFTRTMWAVMEAIKAHPAVAPFASKITVVQGSFMSRLGGGADASAGYHDLGGAVDYRTWNLTLMELNILIHVAREHGLNLSRRDAIHGGFDPHAHGAAGWDSPISSGIVFQWAEYKAGRDGLASRGSDYEWRPSPLVLTPIFTNPEEDYMSNAAEQKLNELTKDIETLTGLVTDLAAGTDEAFKRAWERDKAAAKKAREVSARQIKTLGGVVDALTEVATESDVEKLRKRLNKVRDQVLAAMAADPDIDGSESPVV